MPNYDASATRAQPCAHDQFSPEHYQALSDAAGGDWSGITSLLETLQQNGVPNFVMILLLVFAARLFQRVATGDLIPLRSYLEMRDERDFWRNRVLSQEKSKRNWKRST